MIADAPAPSLIATSLPAAGLDEVADVLRSADLPADDVRHPWREFWRFTKPSGELIGYGGIERQGTDALLRSIVVLPAHRGHGFGRAIVEHLLALAAEAGACDAYLLTTNARGLFASAGFAEFDRRDAPSAIGHSEQAARLCPASATLMHRRVEPMSITIYHNPVCGTSRNVLAMIRNSGEAPHIVEYLKTPPTRAELVDLIARMGIKVRDLLRRKGTPYDELGLDNPALTDDQLLDAMMAHPILINRPIVVTPLGVKLCRPSETVLDILPQPQQGAFSKEDGAPVVDAAGRRVGPAA